MRNWLKEFWFNWWGPILGAILMTFWLVVQISIAVGWIPSSTTVIIVTATPFP